MSSDSSLLSPVDEALQRDLDILRASFANTTRSPDASRADCFMVSNAEHHNPHQWAGFVTGRPYWCNGQPSITRACPLSLNAAHSPHEWDFDGRPAECHGVRISISDSAIEVPVPEQPPAPRELLGIHGQPGSQVIELHLSRSGSLSGYVLATWKADEYVVWRCWLSGTHHSTLCVEAGDYFGPYSPSTEDGEPVTPLERARKRFMERAGLVKPAMTPYEYAQANGPWVVYRSDPEGDDRRGTSHEVGMYRSERRAREVADMNNDALLRAWNSNAQRQHEHQYRDQLKAEHDVLVKAGLRGQSEWLVGTKPEFVPRTEWSTDERVEHYYVHPAEFDDDPVVPSIDDLKKVLWGLVVAYDGEWGAAILSSTPGVLHPWSTPEKGTAGARHWSPPDLGQRDGMKHQVEYLSPGSFMPEESFKTIPARDPGLALAAAPNHAFCFTMYDTEEPPDLGPDFKVVPVAKNRSGRYYIGGSLYGLHDVEAELGPDSILVSNMRGNKWDRMIKCRTGNWQPFFEGDVLLPVPA